MKENEIEGFSLAEISCHDLALLIDYIPRKPIMPSTDAEESILDRNNVVRIQAAGLIEKSRLSESGKIYLKKVFDNLLQTGLDSTAPGEYEDAVAQLVFAPFGKDAGIFGSEAQLHEKYLIQNAISHHVNNTREATDLPTDNDQFLDAVDPENYEVLFDQNPIGQSNYEWLQDYLVHWQGA